MSQVEMKFRKIKWNGTKVHLEWETVDGDDVVEHKLVSFDPPAPAFEGALLQLKEEAIKLLELPEEYGDGMRVIGVTIKEDETRGVGCVITLQKEIERSPAPVIFNTPYLAAWDENYPLPTAIADQLDEIQAAAADYVQGKRSQGDLFEEAA